MENSSVFKVMNCTRRTKIVSLSLTVFLILIAVDILNLFNNQTNRIADVSVSILSLLTLMFSLACVYLSKKEKYLSLGYTIIFAFCIYIFTYSLFRFIDVNPHGLYYLEIFNVGLVHFCLLISIALFTCVIFKIDLTSKNKNFVYSITEAALNAFFVCVMIRTFSVTTNTFAIPVFSSMIFLFIFLIYLSIVRIRKQKNKAYGLFLSIYLVALIFEVLFFVLTLNNAYTSVPYSFIQTTLIILILFLLCANIVMATTQYHGKKLK